MPDVVSSGTKFVRIQAGIDEHNLDPTCTPTQRIHAYRLCENYSPASFIQTFLQFLSERYAYYRPSMVEEQTN